MEAHYFRIFNINADNSEFSEEYFEQYPTELIIKIEEDFRGLDQSSIDEIVYFSLGPGSPFDGFLFYSCNAEEITLEEYKALKGDEGRTGMTIKMLGEKKAHRLFEKEK